MPRWRCWPRRAVKGSLIAASIGCDNPEVHAASVISLLDGLVHDQLLHPEIATPPDKVEDIFRRWLQYC
jgi:hypothetical protein